MTSTQVNTLKLKLQYKTHYTDSCWYWTGAVHSYGYGLVHNEYRNPPKTELAHRLAYELAKGPIPDGLCVCHTCDEPLCINPAHLWLGTKQDNNKDRDDKDRHGSILGLGILTTEQKKTIEQLYSTGKHSFRSLGALFNVSRVTIARVFHEVKH